MGLGRGAWGDQSVQLQTSCGGKLAPGWGRLGLGEGYLCERRGLWGLGLGGSQNGTRAQKGQAGES